jgi:hypothetical protein
MSTTPGVLSGLSGRSAFPNGKVGADLDGYYNLPIHVSSLLLYLNPIDWLVNKIEAYFLYPDFVIELAIRASITDRRGTVRGNEVPSTLVYDADDDTAVYNADNAAEVDDIDW